MQKEMRDRLVELLQEYTDENNGGGSNHGRADHLIENGVIVLPCKLGSDIYMLVTRHTTSFTFDNGKMIRQENQHTIVKKTTFTKSNLFKVIEEFGKTVFLTKEDAEQKLKGGAKE